MPFHDQLLKQNLPIWDTMLSHDFLKATAEGTIDQAAFANWMRQDYLFVRQGLRFISVLVSRSPEDIFVPLAAAVPALLSELELFERMAAEKNVSFENVEISPTCHAYCQFLTATAHSASFEEGFALLYGAEKTYFDSWSWVKNNLQQSSPWQPFINKWSDADFARWVEWIEVTLDRLADETSAQRRDQMAEVFSLAGQYEVLFWDMALQGESWAV